MSTGREQNVLFFVQCFWIACPRAHLPDLTFSMMSPSVHPARFLRWGLLSALLPLLFLTVGCEGDYRPRAVGEEGTITVVMDSSLWTGEVGEALRENVTPWVETLPVSERYFDLQHLELSSEQVYNRIQKLKNVVIVAPLSDSTNEANFLRRRLSNEAEKAIQEGQTAVVSNPNLWRRSQRVYYVLASNPKGLVETLQNQGQEIRGTFTDATFDRMERNMFEDRQYALEDSLMERHGFSVNLQSDYVIAVDTMTETGGFVWMRRLLAQTRREFFVHYIEDASPDQITPEWIYTTRDSLTREYMQGNVTGFVRIDYRRPLDTEQVTFLDRYGFETHGLWYMVTPVEDGEDFRPVGGGGPFVNFTFYDQATDRIYMLDGSVFAPGFDKMDFIRQMEVMARSFRTAEEVESDENSVAAAE